MNYGKKGVKSRQKKLRSRSHKWGRKLALGIFKLLIIVILAAGIIGTSLGLGVFKGILASSPDISKINVTPTKYSTFVYDASGSKIAKLVSTNSNRIPVSIDKVPEDLQHAFVAVEDERFYEHNGIDIQGIIRAGVKGITSGGKFSEGASTITQQLLKNNVFTDWTNETYFIDKVKRKIQEQYLAIELEKSLGPDAKQIILENYMNTINLGQNTLGVQAASLRYFDKDVSELSLSECACIAAITQNPSRLNPITHPEDNAKRRKKVLDNMLEQGYIDQAKYDIAIADNVYARIADHNNKQDDNSVNSYFVDALVDEVLEDLMAAGYTDSQAYSQLYSGGLSIYATQDPEIQAICDEVFSDEENYPEGTKWLLDYALTVKQADGESTSYSKEMLKAYFKQANSKFNLLYESQDEAKASTEEFKQAMMKPGDEVESERISLTPQPQVSLTVEDQSTGYIVALVGGRGAKEASRTLNRATDTVRQPGSTFKIVSTYAPALDSAGLTLATVQNDAPFCYANGRPVSNWYSSGYKGLCSLRFGIEQSLNIIAVKTLTQITPQLGFDYLQNFGFTTLVEQKESKDGTIFTDITQSLALGGITDGVTNKELNAAFAAIANQGTYNKPRLYTKVVDHNGNVILDNTVTQSRQVIKETTSFLLTDAMVDVVTKGTGGSVNFGNMSIAGKTGTTSDYKDIWFSGFTPYYTATTWAGYDNNVELSGSAQKALAKTMWRAVMSRIHEDLPNKPFDVPKGIVRASVCSQSGKLPIPGVCDATVKTEYFADGTVPTESCDVHYQGLVCPYDNLPATDECPFKANGVLTMLPTEAPAVAAGTALAAGLNPASDPNVDPNAQQDPSVPGSTLVNEDGTVSLKKCQHTAAWMAQPNVQELIAAQLGELQQRALAAQQAAEAAAAAGGVPAEADPAAQAAQTPPAEQSPEGATPEADPAAQTAPTP